MFRMPGILEILGNDVETLQGGDGGRFRDFIVSILRAHTIRLGAPDGSVVADHRNVSDGGIDAAVQQAFTNDPTLYCRTPSCWQFKAEPKGRIPATVAAQLVQQDYVRKLVAEGYAYRLCVADNLTPLDIEERETAMLRAIREINAASSPTGILVSIP
jgi:hypothetical protein